MNYIKKSENLTQKFKVVVDTKRLKSLLVLLDKDCYVRRFGKRLDYEGAFNVKGAKEVLDNRVNLANQKVNEVYKFEGLCEGPFWYHGLPYDIKYEAIYRDSVNLVTIIKEILSNVRKNTDVTMLMNELNDYPSSEDFISFDVRAEKALMDVHAQLATNNPRVLETIHTYIDRNIEAKLNENYDFNKLYAIYLEIMKCFKYELVEEKRTYKTR
jgi:hypothetical protein